MSVALQADFATEAQPAVVLNLADFQQKQLPERGIDEPYLKWVEDCAADTGLRAILVESLNARLDQLGCENRIKPDGRDAEEVYLMKCALRYLHECSEYGQQGFRRWLTQGPDEIGQIKGGAIWDRNCALTQIIGKAYLHSYTTASAKAEGKPVLTEQQSIRFYQQQSIRLRNSGPN